MEGRALLLWNNAMGTFIILSLERITDFSLVGGSCICLVFEQNFDNIHRVVLTRYVQCSVAQLWCNKLRVRQEQEVEYAHFVPHVPTAAILTQDQLHTLCITTEGGQVQGSVPILCRDQQ